MIVVLGPAPCRGCGNLVWYGRLDKGRGQTAKLNRWRNSDGKQHKCNRETP